MGEGTAADPESHEGDKDAGEAESGDTRAIGITPFAPVEAVWIELPSSKGLGGVGGVGVGVGVVPRDCGSPMSLCDDEVNTLTISGSEGIAG
jgi:hypothetical protein